MSGALLDEQRRGLALALAAGLDGDELTAALHRRRGVARAGEPLETAEGVGRCELGGEGAALFVSLERGRQEPVVAVRAGGDRVVARGRGPEWFAQFGPRT